LDRLTEALERNRDEVRTALEEAQAELEQLEQRRAELDRLIARARAALGEETRVEERGDLKLHEALELVLSKSKTDGMGVGDLALEINRRNLYRMKDGRPVEASQIHARVSNYKHLFEKNGSIVRLRYRFSTSPLQQSGAYSAVKTIIERVADGAEMYLETRLAYSVRPPDNHTSSDYLVALAEERARKLVAQGGFKAGGEDVALLTTLGWQQLRGPGASPPPADEGSK
jgi:hypothetical protein